MKTRELEIAKQVLREGLTCTTFSCSEVRSW